MSRLLLAALAAALLFAACGGEADQPSAPATAQAPDVPAPAQDASAQAANAIPTATPEAAPPAAASPAPRQRRAPRRARSRRPARSATSGAVFIPQERRTGRRRGKARRGSSAPAFGSSGEGSVGKDTSGAVVAGAPVKPRRSATQTPEGFDSANAKDLRTPSASQSLKLADLAGLALGSSTLAQVRKHLGKPVSERSTKTGRCLLYGAIDQLTGKPSAHQRWQLCFTKDRRLASRATINV